MTSAIAVAQAFLDLATNEDRRLTNMQLQKLVFFAHGTHLAAYGEPLICDPIRAWDFGPVIPPLYDRLRQYRSRYVDPVIDPGARDQVDPKGSMSQCVGAVWKAYKDHDGWSLSRITHLPGTPWSEVWERRQYGDIPNELIREYYQGRVRRTNAADT